MTKIKMCGLTSTADIAAVNKILPEYIGFVFFSKSRRNISWEKAAELKMLLDPSIRAVGVFVNEAVEQVAKLLNDGVIDIAQLHGHEDEVYITQLRTLTDQPIMKAFTLKNDEIVQEAEKSSADMILLDSGAGTGRTFDWSLASMIRRPYFLAGGLDPQNAAEAVRALQPYAVDVSSGIETEGKKDPERMAAFSAAVREVSR